MSERDVPLARYLGPGRNSWRAALAGSLLALTGCPERATGPSPTTAPCREVGQRCEVSPGKLGSCVVNDDCQGQNCFVCQSQH